MQAGSCVRHADAVGQGRGDLPCRASRRRPGEPGAGFGAALGDGDRHRHQAPIGGRARAQHTDPVTVPPGSGGKEGRTRSRPCRIHHEDLSGLEAQGRIAHPQAQLARGLVAHGVPYVHRERARALCRGGARNHPRRVQHQSGGQRAVHDGPCQRSVLPSDDLQGFPVGHIDPRPAELHRSDRQQRFRRRHREQRLQSSRRGPEDLGSRRFPERPPCGHFSGGVRAAAEGHHLPTAGKHLELHPHIRDRRSARVLHTDGRVLGQDRQRRCRLAIARDPGQSCGLEFHDHGRGTRDPLVDSANGGRPLSGDRYEP